ncbi:MAG: CehA/McbA family metallohydrolase [Oscillospiraceae bacterium]|nr:CehA/McbA family metallohydrolase [Oscillospiraceae bacterium]
MKHILIDSKLNQYKTNLHCHTDYSDGKYTPQQVKDLYKKNGYSAVAYTDHDIFVCHDELSDDEFISLHGYEIEVTEENDNFSHAKTCHICLVSLDAKNTTPVCLHHHKYMFQGALTHFDEMSPFEGDYERKYSPECINDIIAKAKEAGFFVTYNHPVWSMESYPQYSRYKGMDAMEMFNYLSITDGYEDCNHQVYDDFLRLGMDIGCTGNDDNHNSNVADRTLDSCGAWTMIVAPVLKYDALVEALKNGRYYASMGPSILSLYVDEGIVFIETTDAVGISFSTGIRHTAKVTATKNGFVNKASFQLREDDEYFRVTVEDDRGKKAYTRGYRVKELI